MNNFSLHTFFQGEYEFSPEILSGKLAEVVYKNATENIKGKDFGKLWFHFFAKQNKRQKW